MSEPKKTKRAFFFEDWVFLLTFLQRTTGKNHFPPFLLTKQNSACRAVWSERRRACTLRHVGWALRQGLERTVTKRDGQKSNQKHTFETDSPRALGSWFHENGKKKKTTNTKRWTRNENRNVFSNNRRLPTTDRQTWRRSFSTVFSFPSWRPSAAPWHWTRALSLWATK